MNTDSHAGPRTCTPRTRPEAPPGGFGSRPLRTSVAVLAESPVIGEGLAELIRRMGLFDVVGASTDVEDVLDLVECGGVRVVVISTSGRAQEFARRALEGINHAASSSDATVGTVYVVSPPGAGTSDRVDVEASAVVSTEAGVDGLAAAVFEARRCHRPAVRTGQRSRRPDTTRSRPAGGRPVLTPRELEVLQGMADGLASKHIAEQLGVSVHTVRTHVQRLLPKLGVHTRLRATAVALEEGLVTQRPATRLVSRYASQPAGARSAPTAG